MNNFILIAALILMAVSISYIAYQIRQTKNDLEEIRILFINHQRYSGVSHQYTLVAAKVIMMSCMQQCIDEEDYKTAAEWKSAIDKVNKLIETKINI